MTITQRHYIVLRSIQLRAASGEWNLQEASHEQNDVHTANDLYEFDPQSTRLGNNFDREHRCRDGSYEGSRIIDRNPSLGEPGEGGNNYTAPYDTRE